MTLEDHAETIEERYHNILVVSGIDPDAFVQDILPILQDAIREAVKQERERCCAAIEGIQPIGMNLNRDEMGRGYVMGVNTTKSRAIAAIHGQEL